jgi:hypothetical protein
VLTQKTTSRYEKENRKLQAREDGEKERIWSHLRNMPALESEVEHAYNEEDPASDKQTSKYE